MRGGWTKEDGAYVRGEFVLRRNGPEWDLFDAEGFDRSFDTMKAATDYVDETCSTGCSTPNWQVGLLEAPDGSLAVEVVHRHRPVAGWSTRRTERVGPPGGDTPKTRYVNRFSFNSDSPE